MRAGELAYQSLRSDIMEGMLAPGSVIAEVEQSERLGVSRTPVREAISRLLAEGLAEPAPGRGVIVAPISLANVYALFELRTSLDSTAAALAARRGDSKVFKELAQAFEEASFALHRGEASLAEYYSLVDELDTAIDAAMHPADGNWLYFVTWNMDTGETIFSDTYAEHEAAIAKWNEWCTANDNRGC